MNSFILKKSVPKEKVEILDVKSESNVRGNIALDKHKNLPNIMEDIPGIYENDTDYNISKMCRICLLPKDSLIQASTDVHKEISEMYLTVTSIKMNKGSHAMLQICELCNNDLVFCYNFKIKCQRSDYLFRSLIDGTVPKEEIDESRRILEADIKIESDAEEMAKEEVDEHEDIEYLEDNEFDYNIENLELNLINDEEPRNIKKIDIADTKNVMKRKSARIKNKIGKDRKRSYICSFCSKKFLKMITLKAHIVSEHGPENLPYSCKQCKKTFSSEHDLDLHSTIHTAGNTWTCNKCHKTFQERSRFRRHIQRHMDAKRHACAFCGKPFAELYALRRHERVHTGEVPDKRHACHLCDKRYSSRKLLTEHIGLHNGIRPCVCPSCGKTFPSQRLLASHRLIHSDKKPHACLYCDKTFRHESTRNTHHRTHTGEKPFVCATCGKAFIQRSNLILHMRTHTGERPYSCKICESKFTSGSSLKNHMRIHTGDKPYSCPVCEKRFARVDMRAHMTQHTGERPHTCSVCSRGFASAWRLREHCRIHTGEKPFECANCTDKFTTKSQLMKHYKTHQKQRKPLKKREVIIMPAATTEEHVYENEELNKVEENPGINNDSGKNSEDVVNIVHAQDMPLEVTQEVVLHDGGEEKADMLMVDCQNVTIDHRRDLNESNVNYMTVNENGVSISSTAMVEGATVKLYQLDQSLVQIHRSGDQLTISKITSKMTANF